MKKGKIRRLPRPLKAIAVLGILAVFVYVCIVFYGNNLIKG